MNYCDDLLRQCKTLENRRLAIELDTGNEITFGTLRDRIQSLAGYLTAQGIGPGTAVAIHLFNGIDAIVMHMAVQYVGARSCFIDALVQPKSLEYYVRTTACRLLVTHVTTNVLAPEVLEQTTVLSASTITNIAQEQRASYPAAPYDWSSDEVCYVYFTSGTTNVPKGVMLSSGNHANFTRICDTYWRPVNEESKHLCYVPFSHGFGTIFLVPLAIRTGSELYLLRAFHPLRVTEAVAQQGITHIYGVPSHYQQLLRLPDAKNSLCTLKMAFCAAAKLEHDLMLEWERTTRTILCEGYGLIETCCGTVWRVGVPSLGTGHMGPCPDPKLVEIAIFDVNDEPLARGETGQIAVRGPSVMKGYLNLEQETARVMRNGWFLTGDKGHITPDGELFMTGRIKDIINIAGIKVSPYEVEAVLNQHPAVAEVAVVAAPDKLYGEVVKAYVRVKLDAEVTERDLIRFAATYLMNFQVPKSVEFVDVFPLNNMGKLDRNQLRAINPV
jgi:long-chain acyl-CoA synthetase